MEQILIKGVQLVLALSLLVVIHEFGHYIFARIFGIRADNFFLFFNPGFSLVRYDPLTKKWSFFKKNMTEEERLERTRKVKQLNEKNGKSTWRDTVYGIGWLPLGGYVSIGGMIDESMDKNQMAEPVHATDFRAKPAWQRFFVMFGGVLFNFILAIIIYAGIAFWWGDKYIPYDKATEGMDFSAPALQAGFRTGDIPLLADGEPVLANDPENIYKLANAKEVTVLRQGNDTVTFSLPENFLLSLGNSGFMSYRFPVYVKEVLNGEPAEKAGLEPGDRIVAVGDSLTPAYTEFAPSLAAYSGKEVPLKVIRDGKEITLAATPNEEGKLGFQLKEPKDVFEVETVSYNLLSAFPKGISDGTDKLVSYVSSLKYLFTKSGAQSLGGFGSIGALFPPKWSWLSFWEITAFLSVILAFMNILPIPALDGGHIVFVLWEMVTGRKPSEAVLEKAQMVGLLFLVLLLIYANANDIYRFLIK